MIVSEVPVSGSKYPRAKRVIIDNPINGTPIATFINEQVYAFADGEVVHKDLSASFTAGLDVNAQINILNPADDSVEATQPYGYVLAQVYKLLYSVHRHVGV